MQVVCAYDNDETLRFTYEYDSKGHVAFVKDSIDNGTIRTGYDQTDRPNETEQRDGDGYLKYRTLIEYDKKNRVKAFNEATSDQNFRTEYTYDSDNRVTKVRYNSSDTSKVDYVYDKLNRITSRTVTNGTNTYATQYAYTSGAAAYGENATTPLVSSITQGDGENAMNFAYTYDNRGNITSETRNGLTTTYVYDALGQLVRVNDPHENATWIYTYDRGGNILNKAKYAYTTEGELGEAVESIPYTYGDGNWKDKLTAYNGVPITYDAIGNPLNDGTWTYEWQAGRQLKSMTNAATGVTMEFTYNHAGLRTKKVKKVNGVLAETTEYILSGKNVVGLTHTDHASNEVDMMRFFYDAQGRAAQVNFNGSVYSYVRNLQGDIVGMLDNSGILVVEYKYEAWGNELSVEGLLADTLGKMNPFRYRGYVYDEESEVYYLQSRYYVPKYACFLNADIHISARGVAIGCNLYAYCKNSPIVRVDELGADDWWAIFPDMGFVHRKVQDHIIENNGVAKLRKEVEIYFPGGGHFKWGYWRADIFDTHTGEIWEVKPVHSMAVGRAQLQMYLAGNCYGKQLEVGKSIFKGRFETQSPSGVLLNVDYYTISGVVGYQFEAVKQKVTVPVTDSIEVEEEDRAKRSEGSTSTLSVGLSLGVAFGGMSLGAAMALFAQDRRITGGGGEWIAYLY